MPLVDFPANPIFIYESAHCLLYVMESHGGFTSSGVKLRACKLPMDMFHYKKKGVDDIITVGDFYKQGSGAGTHRLFI